MIEQDGDNHTATLNQQGDGQAYGIFQVGEGTEGHVDQQIDGDTGLLRTVEGGGRCNPGHGIEFVGFALRMHDWRKVYWAAEARPDRLGEYFDAYTPGEHWLHLVRELPKEDALEMGLDAPQWLAASLTALAPPYRFILWEPG